MSLEDKLYLENIEEYVYDESKILTYKTLSYLLEVHVNSAKQMLYEFVELQRNKKDKDDLHVTYFLTGYNHAKEFKVQLVPEELLTVVKETFSSVSSCHVYSVQGCKISDAAMLYNVDYDIAKDNISQSNKFSSITCLAAKVRSDEEMTRQKSVAQPTTNAATFQQESKNTIGKPKPNAISSMFGKPSQKPSESTRSTPAATAADAKESDAKKASTKVVSEPSKAGKKPAPSNKPGGLGFFGKQGVKKDTMPEKPALPQISSPPAESCKITTPPKSSEASSAEAIPVTKSSEAMKKGKSKASTYSKKRLQKTEPAEKCNEKKRRRIQAAVWSDSSSEDEEQQDEEMIPPTPPRDPSPTPPSPASPPTPDLKSQISNCETEPKCDEASPRKGSDAKKRIKKRKMVSRTTVTDDGYMQTEKVWEDYSTDDASESVEEDATPSASKANPTSKSTAKPAQKSPPKKQKKMSPDKQAGKQTSLMSFFKRK